MATHSSVLAWRIPWMGILGGYSPWGYEESDMTVTEHACTCYYSRCYSVTATQTKTCPKTKFPHMPSKEHY